MDAVGSTWISISWEQVPTSAGISSQIVTFSQETLQLEISTAVAGGQVNFNATDLLPATMYRIQVETVADNGQSSFPSVAISAMTLYLCKPLLISISVVNT